MDNTIAFVTNQIKSDRIIIAAKEIADLNNSQLIVAEIQNFEYKLDPAAVDHLFELSKKSNATMRMLFAEDKLKCIYDIINEYDSKYIVTGMPQSSDSVLYKIWNQFPHKKFFTVEPDGTVNEVAAKSRSHIA